jgi:hypothetical protein
MDGSTRSREASNMSNIATELLVALGFTSCGTAGIE